MRKKIQHQDYPVRFLAVAAPQWQSRVFGDVYSLDSETPFSLQNAIRCIVQEAKNKKSCLNLTNWSDSRLLEDSVFMMRYFEEEKGLFIEKIKKIKPHIIFIGAMTLCYPGAIALAKIAKGILGKKVQVILGGKHVNETIFIEKEKVVHVKKASPVYQIMENKILPNFDIIISGDAEDILLHIARVYAKYSLDKKDFFLHKNFSFFKRVQGRYILCVFDGKNFFTHLGLTQMNDEYRDALPAPTDFFQIRSNFAVFGKNSTAHVYCDMGKGCLYDCFYCSEAVKINGPVKYSPKQAIRLYNRLKLLKADSAFVEDSIMLGGISKSLGSFAFLCEKEPLNLVYGAQFTVDNLLNPRVQEAIIQLRKTGLVYVFFGMETFNEDLATKMSKNIKRNKLNPRFESWLSRNERAISFLSLAGIKIGISVLWGLGETQEDRLAQLDFFLSLQENGIGLDCISLNWATQHPLVDINCRYDFIEWGTSKNSPYLEYFISLFGEASERYLLEGVSLPTIREMEDLRRKWSLLKIKN